MRRAKRIVRARNRTKFNRWLKVARRRGEPWWLIEMVREDLSHARSRATLHAIVAHQLEFDGRRFPTCGRCGEYPETPCGNPCSQLPF